MEHLNFCRQMVKQFSKSMSMSGFPKESKEPLSHAIDLANSSQKFLLPDGGRLYDDKEYRAIDENEPLNLPYKFIALEYTRNFKSEDKNKYQPKKALLFARERDDCIVITPIVWVEHYGMWAPYPEVAIHRTGFLDRSKVINGYTAIKLYNPNSFISNEDYADEIGALLCFLNVLKCNNVHIDKSNTKASGKKIKSALAFDTYHVLTIDVARTPGAGNGIAGCDHRSPREHLRRGHIRRLADGRRIWVNATVVAAGRKSGFVEKDYLIRAGHKA